MSTRELVELASDAIEAGEEAVLCSVVRLDGSGYGRPGAKLLVTASGQRVGYISGGCLEKDLCRRVWAATERGPRLIAFDTRGNSVTTSRYNTGCEGVVYVLCQRISDRQRLSIDTLDRVNRTGSVARTLTIYRSESDGYRVGDQYVEVADERLVLRDGMRLEEIVEREWLHSNRNRSLEFTDSAGRVVEAAVEVLRPPNHLVLFGAGDDVVPVVRMGASLGWHVTVVGNRPELACPERFATQSGASSVSVRCGVMTKIAADELRLRDADVLVMTHDFAADVDLLSILLRSDARSVGLLGPKRRLGRLVTALYERGHVLSEYEMGRLRSPIGLDIGASTSDEIAVSIIAELVAMNHHRDANRLHDRTTSVHEPCEHRVIPGAAQC